MSDERVLNALFLCTGNSARSIMAEAILNRKGAGRFRAFSAGSQPKGEVHPFTIHLLQSLNYDTSGFRSKSWNEFAHADAPLLDFVFTVCDNAANELCPVWPGQPITANWGVPDPAAVDDDETVQHAAFFDAYRMLFNRISLFTNLPFEGLDKLSLQNRLKAIGKDSARASIDQNTPEYGAFSVNPVDIIIYHNPNCGTSRNTLAMIRNTGIEPHVIEYLKTPPSRTLLVQLITRAGLTPRELLREKGTPFADLELGDETLSDETLIDAMMAHPILINRPLVVSPMGVRLCRPSEVVLDILPTPQKGPFAKEDGELVIDDAGNRVSA